MSLAAPRLSALLVTATVAASLVLTAPAANAVPVFTSSQVIAEGLFFDRSDVDCTRDAPGSDRLLAQPVAENGPGTVASASATGTLTRNTDASDVVSSTARFEATSSVTSLAGNPQTVDIAGQGSVAVSATHGTSQCRAEAVSRVALDSAFTVSQGGFLTITTTVSPHALLLIDFQEVSSADRIGKGAKPSGPLTVYLAPGSYRGDFEIGARVSSGVTVAPTPVSASIHGEFTVAGSQLAPSQGKGGKYLLLPTARSCAAHALLPVITAKKGQARRIKRVALFVNSAKVRTVRSPHRGAQLVLPAADGERADVRAEIALVPKRKGRPAKVLATTATYEACS